MVGWQGNYATSASSSSWDLVANNNLKMTDTGNVTGTAAHEDAIAVYSLKIKQLSLIKLTEVEKVLNTEHRGLFR